ncbi:MAG TPA: hypothetical protein VG204_18165 [Terriglobia bacterium]|nr:hypothetical protein [Terriglobia bacterium]
MTTSDYIWGSNAVAANYGLQLLVANAMRPDPQYVEAAIENLPTCWAGTRFRSPGPPRLAKIHFAIPTTGRARLTGPEPWLGLMAGGPNRFRQDHAMRKLPDLPPAKMLDE